MLMKSSISFSKNTLFSQSVSSASISSVLRRIKLGDWRRTCREPLPPASFPDVSVYHPQGVFGDVGRGTGPAETFRCVPHLLQPRGIIEKRGDFPCGGRQVVAANCCACFQQMIGVAFFLAGDGFDERHGKSTSEGL